MTYFDGPIRIGMVAPPWYQMPPAGCGPVSRLVSLLAEDMAGLGHEVTVIGAGGNSLRGVSCHSTFDEPQLVKNPGNPLVELVHAVEATKLLAGMDLDVIHVHDHVGLAFFTAMQHPPAPSVLTVHGPVSALHARLYRSIAGTTSLIAISRAQRNGNYGHDVAWADTIYNGLPIAEFPYESDKKDYALWLGRMVPEKGPELAIEATRAAGVPLVLAGRRVLVQERAYFEERVRPLLGPDVEWVGEVEGTDKSALLARARCLINPIQWDEPFGLVMIEAMACGTPVVAMKRGAAAEIVRHGVTGYLCDSVDELADWIQRADTINPAACRQHVEAHFTTERMVQGYLAAYSRAIKR